MCNSNDVRTTGNGCHSLMQMVWKEFKALYVLTLGILDCNKKFVNGQASSPKDNNSVYTMVMSCNSILLVLSLREKHTHTDRE